MAKKIKHPKANKVSPSVFCFWTGDNPMTANRLRNLEITKASIGMPLILITSENLNEYIKAEAPLHPAYQYLSCVHKSDYLRTYFMHHYGGGYTDIKRVEKSWAPFFVKLECSDVFAIGYPERSREDVAFDGTALSVHLANNYSKLLGNCGYLFKANTTFTQHWMELLHQRLDEYLPHLRNNPGNIWGDNKGYPIPWTGILGDIFHPLCLTYSDKLLFFDDIRFTKSDYR
ncbi:capsular polysaccharide synthesis protein [Persicobacter sp. CCB-QB2]|uniref:capsular polysaccharide synthesis protein n=1 Tax=Persicobacter sp. CCB-QB2 TaxID=1561025 RepID=UPI001C10E0DC|nr:capsular polysaccharide synthesis protein [Persicobacter sp. CCB-QB2]